MKNKSEYVKKRRKIVREAVRKLEEKPCADCGREYPHYVMHFDHVRGEKKFVLSLVSSDTVGLQRALDEAAKCDVVCANCHAIRTHRGKIAE